MSFKANPTLEVGDTFWQEIRPFLAEVMVVRIIAAGAELQYTGRTAFAGFEHLLVAGDGTPLTLDVEHGFLGRAHWNGLEIIPGTTTRETDYAGTDDGIRPERAVSETWPRKPGEDPL